LIDFHVGEVGGGMSIYLGHAVPIVHNLLQAIGPLAYGSCFSLHCCSRELELVLAGVVQVGLGLAIVLVELAAVVHLGVGIQVLGRVDRLLDEAATG